MRTARHSTRIRLQLSGHELHDGRFARTVGALLSFRSTIQFEQHSYQRERFESPCKFQRKDSSRQACPLKKRFFKKVFLTNRTNSHQCRNNSLHQTWGQQCLEELQHQETEQKITIKTESRKQFALKWGANIFVVLKNWLFFKIFFSPFSSMTISTRSFWVFSISFGVSE